MKILNQINQSLAAGDGDTEPSTTVLSPGRYKLKTAYHFDPLLAKSVVIEQPNNWRAEREIDGGELWKQRSGHFWKPMLLLLIAVSAMVQTTPTYATVKLPTHAETLVIQQILHDNGYAIHVDGDYGRQTTKVIKAWQRANGLVVDGVAGRETIASINRVAKPLATVRRSNSRTRKVVPPAQAPTPVASEPTPGFSDNCAEMSWYRQQAGLPEIFDRIGYRESNCRNEDGVRTSCCYGYWQNYISSHLSSQSAYRDRIINECGVSGAGDINSDNPDDKRRQACVTYVVWSISGMGPWSL